MGRIILALTLLVFWLDAAIGAPVIFPSNSENPTQAGGRELLEAVCPGHVATRKKVHCQIPCPAFTGFSGEDFDWSSSRVTRGHFLSPASDDAALWMQGCEPHVYDFGGTALLTRRSGRWTMVWYKHGVVTGQCHRVSLRNGRDILVCLTIHGGQGFESTTLYLEDLLEPTHPQYFFEVSDNTGDCGWNVRDESKPFPLMHSYIQKVEFKSSSASGGPPAISVIAATGAKQMSVNDVNACQESPNGWQAFLPPIKSYRIDFIFDGHGYKVVPTTAAAARIFHSP